MDIERFAGENPVMQAFAQSIANNNALMKRRQGEALQNAYEARARNVAATGVSNASLYL